MSGDGFHSHDWVSMRDQLHAFSEEKPEALLYTPKFIAKSSLVSVVFSQMSEVLTLRHREVEKKRRTESERCATNLGMCVHSV